MAQSEEELCSSGCQFLCVTAENYGIISDNSCFQESLLRLLHRKSTHLTHTVTDYNVKNARCQAIIGRNSVKVIGNQLIDARLLLNTRTQQELHNQRIF